MKPKAGTFLLAVTLFLLAAGNVFASPIVFPLSHPVYSEMEALYSLEGRASPSGIRPWSETEVRAMAEKILPETESGRELKTRIEGYLEDRSEPYHGYFDLEFSPTAAFHTNPASFGTESSWAYPDAQDRPLLSLKFALSGYGFIALYADFSLTVMFADVKDFHSGIKEGFAATSEPRYSSSFDMNIPFLLGGGFPSVSFPLRAYLSLGSSLRFTIGRDRLSWGSGIMGNLVLGDNLPYHDYASITYTGSDFFRCQTLLSFFSHSENFYVPNNRFAGIGLRFLLAHRFEFSFLDGRINFALSESTVYQSAEGAFDFGLFNPLFFLHHLHMKDRSNPLFTLDAEWAPGRNITLYLQAALQRPGNGDTSWGTMAGIKGSVPKNGSKFWYYAAEFVYTSPYLFRAFDSSGAESFDLSYISAIRFEVQGYPHHYIADYLSVPFGGDSYAAALRFGINSPGSYKAEANIYALSRGPLSSYGSTDKDSPREYTLSAGAEGEWQILSWLSADGAIYGNLVWNKGNAPSSAVFDLQISAGISMRY